jgi:hypothetical protein
MERNFTRVPRKPICLEHELLTNSLEQSRWEADSRWASQKIPCHLWNLRFQCIFHNTPHWTLSSAIWILSAFSRSIYLMLSSHLWICFMGGKKKVKVNLSLCFNWAPHYEGVLEMEV